MNAIPDRVIAGLVGGRYEITGLIAQGGMGSVYRARDTVLERTVALKVLKAGADDEQFVRRFREEATNAARLSHPNIVQVYDFGSDEGRPYMAMEYVEGQTLRDILQARGVLRPEVAARVAHQVALALEHARRAGLVHRDVKPENILITTEGQVKVADFGLSRAMAEARATQTGVLVGTAHYLAPEQVEGRDVDHRADVYALGVVLYEMLAGRPPFGGDSPVVIAYKRVAEDVPSPMALNPSVPSELDRVVARATARAPADRFPTAGAMAEELRDSVPRFDTGEVASLVHHTQAIPLMVEPTVAIARGEAERRKRKRRMRRNQLIALGVALMLLAGSALALTNRLAKTDVPSVVSLSQTAAESALEGQGFAVKVAFENSSTVPATRVISQLPAAGARVRKGTPVQLTVSLGPEVLRLLDVRGKPFKNAEELLRAKGFTKIKRTDVFDPEAKRLTVIAQDPDSGVLVERSTTITLTVSKGPELIAVPNVVGDAEEPATTKLEDAGFVVVVKRETNEEVSAGIVADQAPNADKKLEKGKTVTITVSKGPPLVAVPTVRCMTRRQAADALASKGFKVTYEGRGTRVVDQEPAPDAQAPKGSTVTAIMGSGAFC